MLFQLAVINHEQSNNSFDPVVALYITLDKHTKESIGKVPFVFGDPNDVCMKSFVLAFTLHTGVFLCEPPEEEVDSSVSSFISEIRVAQMLCIIYHH
jgi:hypothetical protein